MFLNNKKYNADFIQGGGDNPLAGFNAFMPDDSDVPVQLKEPVVEAVETKIDEKTKESTPAKKADEKPDATIEEKVDEKNKEVKTEDKEEIEEVKFKIPGEEDEEEVEYKEPEQWADAAKLLEIEGAEEVKSFENLHEKISQHIEKVEAEAETRVLEKIKTQTKEEIAQLLEIHPRAKEIIDFVNDGGDLDDYLYPQREVSKYLALSDEDLIKQDLLAMTDKSGKQILSEDEVEVEINGLIESGRLGIEGKKLRAQLEAQAEEMQSETVALHQQYKETQKAVQQQNEQKYTEALKVALSGIDSYMGGPITPKHREYLLGEFAAGKFGGKFDDPKDMAEFMVHKRFGDQALKQLKKTEFQKGKDKIQDKLHNIPPALTPAGASKKISSEPKKEGDFTAWNDLSSVSR